MRLYVIRTTEAYKDALSLQSLVFRHALLDGKLANPVHEVINVVGWGRHNLCFATFVLAAVIVQSLLGPGNLVLFRPRSQ